MVKLVNLIRLATCLLISLRKGVSFLAISVPVSYQVIIILNFSVTNLLD